MILHALAVLGALCVFGPLAVVCLIVIRGLRSDPYPPQAAEAPDPIDEHFTTTKPIYAGSDLDGDLPTGALTELYNAIDAYKRGEDITKDAPKERV